MDIKKLLPLTESTYLILVSLIESNHGYGIIQMVERISDGRIILGPGTLYGALGKLEKSGFIRKDLENSEDRRKNYVLTNDGKILLKSEYERQEMLINSTKDIVRKGVF